VSEPLVSVRDLAVVFPARSGSGRGRGATVRALDGVSLDIARGETVGLVGESGSGKTTLVRCLLGLLEPTAGEARFDGAAVPAATGLASRDFRRRVQVVFQDPFASLNPRIRVGGALREVLAVHGLAGADGGRSRASALLERVGLVPATAERYPHELSGGQRQRVAIARALAVEPELLVLDEPVSALDVSVRAQVVNLLADLQAELDLTYLFVAHDLALVEHVSDRVAVMYLGRIVEAAPTAELFRRPRHPYTRALISAVPAVAVPRSASASPRRRRAVLDGDTRAPASPPSGCAFHSRCPHPLKDEECARTRPALASKAAGHRSACLKERPEP
jgi:oligopeptide/dipeptide ABC transporter ATP-binding protein